MRSEGSGASPPDVSLTRNPVPTEVSTIVAGMLFAPVVAVDARGILRVDGDARAACSAADIWGPLWRAFT